MLIYKSGLTEARRAEGRGSALGFPTLGFFGIFGVFENPNFGIFWEKILGIFWDFLLLFTANFWVKMGKNMKSKKEILTSNHFELTPRNMKTENEMGFLNIEYTKIVVLHCFKIKIL